jgi:hypothetical protein
MVISGLRYREIYPQKEFSWGLSLRDIPTTGNTYFKFSFSGLNGNIFEIFNIKNKKIYSNNNEFIGGYDSLNSIINLSGEINNNYYSLFQNQKNLFIGKEIPDFFKNTLIRGFVFESLQENFVNFQSFQILGERPEYFIDNSRSFDYEEISIPINIFNSGEFPFEIYSGKISDPAFGLNLPSNFIVPSNGQNTFFINNLKLLDGFKRIPLILYSEIGTLNVDLNFSGTKIDESTYYLTFGPSSRVIQNNSSRDYRISYFNINGTDLIVELKHISGLTGNYNPPRFVRNNFNINDNITSFASQNTYYFNQLLTTGLINFGTDLVAIDKNLFISDTRQTVRIFHDSGNKNWNLKYTLTGNQNNVSIGFSDNLAVSIDSSILVLGSEGSNVIDGRPIGGVNIFTGNINNGWNFKQSLSPIEPPLNLSGVFGQFGRDVVINDNGNIIAISSPLFGIPNGFSSTSNGGLIIYTGNSNDGWIFKQFITGTLQSQFGSSIDITNDGDVIVVGAPYERIPPGSSLYYGAIYIFTGNANNGWSLKDKIYGDALFDLFSNPVKISRDGNCIITSDGRFTFNTGVAYIFTGNKNNGWSLKQSITGFGRFGPIGETISVTNNADKIVLSSWREELNSIPYGVVRIFTGDINNGWQLNQSLSGLNFNSSRNFGRDTAINENNNLFIRGNSFSNSGQVFIFSNENLYKPKDILISGYITGSGIISSPIEGIISYFNPINNQIETGGGVGLVTGFKIAEPDPLPTIKLLQNVIKQTGNFGDVSALAGDYLYISSPNNLGGNVTIFRRNGVQGFSEVSTINNPETNFTGDKFGFSLSSSKVENSRLFIGAPFDVNSGITGGAVWIYYNDPLENKFIFKQKITGDITENSFTTSGNCFGYSLKSNFNGNKVFISSPYGNNGSGFISVYTGSLFNINTNIYSNYFFHQKITGYGIFNNEKLKNFGTYLYTNNQGNLLVTSDNKFIYIYKEINQNWDLDQTIETNFQNYFSDDLPYFYANNDCSFVGFTSNDYYTYFFTGDYNNKWDISFSSYELNIPTDNKTKYLISDDKNLFILSNPFNSSFYIFTGLKSQNNFFDIQNLREIIPFNNLSNINNSLIISHDGTLFGFGTGNNTYNLYNYYPPNFVSFDYVLTLTGVGDAYLFTDIPANSFVTGITYSGEVTYLGGNLTGYYNSALGTGFVRDDYFGWEYNANGNLVNRTLSTSNLDIICKYRPELSICKNRGSENRARPIVTGLIDGLDLKFYPYTGIIYADYPPEDLTTTFLVSPLVAVTGRLTGIFDTIGFAMASGIPGRVSGKILGDFGQYFEPGTWTLTKPWSGAISGKEFLNLLDEQGFNPIAATINKINVSGYLSRILTLEIPFEDFCTEELIKFPGIFEVSGTPRFISQIPDKDVLFDPRTYRFAKNVFAVTPKLSGVEWEYENSDFQLQSGFIPIYDGHPKGGRTRISRLGNTISGSGKFNNVFQLPFIKYDPDGAASQGSSVDSSTESDGFLTLPGEFIDTEETSPTSQEIQYISAELTPQIGVGKFDDFKIHRTNASGTLLYKQRVDFLGNPEFKVKKKCKLIRFANGDPIFDDIGEPISVAISPPKFVNTFDEAGNPILDNSGRPVQSLDCEPELGLDGEILTDFYYIDENVLYTDLNVENNKYYQNLSGLRINRNVPFYISFNGLLANSKISWESAFELNGNWQTFNLFDSNNNSYLNINSQDYSSFIDLENFVLSGKLPFGYNYLRVKSEKIDDNLSNDILILDFSGIQKSKIPIIIPDIYQITTTTKFAGWEESLKTVDRTLLQTGTPPCLESIKGKTFFFDPCDSSYMKINVIKPTFYSEILGLNLCFQECFEKWPKLNSIILREGFFYGYNSQYYKSASVFENIKLGICEKNEPEDKKKYFEVLSAGCCLSTPFQSSSSSSEIILSLYYNPSIIGACNSNVNNYLIAIPSWPPKIGQSVYNYQFLGELLPSGYYANPAEKWWLHIFNDSINNMGVCNI